MKKTIIMVILPLILNAADTFYNNNSFQSYSGLINIPTAEVIEDKKIEFSFSNQVDTLTAVKDRNDYLAQQYFVNIGFLPNLEIVGRLSNIEEKGKPRLSWWRDNFLYRDLSASFKYQIPFYHKYLPKFAIGAQDLGGAVSAYESKYIVATKEYMFMRGTVGYGSGQLDGLFGGLELKAADWCTLMGEYDSRESHIGVRFNTPENLLPFGDFSLLAKTNLDDEEDDLSISINFKMPLGNPHHNETTFKDAQVANDVSLTPNTKVLESLPVVPDINSIELLEKSLVDIGFENIDLGDTSDTIYIAFENTIFEHNELDAIGVVLGYMVEHDLPYKKFELVIKKTNLKIKSIKGDLEAYKTFIHDYSPISERAFLDSLVIDTSYADIPLKVSNANSSYLKPRLQLGIGTSTVVGTETGIFEYLISARPYLHLNLYKGLDFGVLYDIPFLRSTEYMHYGAFQHYDEGPQMSSALLHYTFVYENLINIVSAGYFKDNKAIFNNTVYTYDDHTFKLKLGRLEDKDTGYTRDVKLATYKYYTPWLDAFAELTYGTYYNQDKGYDIQLKRFFGDTMIKVFYQNTDAAEYMGAGFEIPLTPRKIPNFKYGQIKGKHDFKYQLRSVVFADNNRNYLTPSGAVYPTSEHELEEQYLNRNRLSESYIRKHILRLRDAYIKYVAE